ncbi:MAG: efflux RND transporter periplasmic adaptor subunit [Alphaproteobacteria bacterium]
MDDNTKRLVALGLIAVVVISALYGGYQYFFGSDSDEAAFDPITVEAEKVRQGSIVRRVTTVGSLLADNEVTIHPEIEGIIEAVKFRGGEFVQKGDVLVRLDDRLYQARVKEAEAEVLLWKNEYERYKKLAAQSAGPKKEQEKSYARMLEAEAKRDQARYKLDNTVIRAPFDGVVGLKKFSIGGLVDQRTELLTIIDIDPIKIDFRVPATYLKAISIGQEVTMEIDGYDGQEFTGVIDALDARVDAAAHSITVRAKMDNKQGMFKPGQFARVRMVVGSKDNTLLLPEAAIHSRGDEEFVYRVVNIPHQEKIVPTAYKLPVETGLSEGGVVEVVRGLSEGDQVITIGVSKIRHGYPVRVVEDIEDDDSLEEDDDDDDDFDVDDEDDGDDDDDSDDEDDVKAESEESENSEAEVETDAEETETDE